MHEFRECGGMLERRIDAPCFLFLFSGYRTLGTVTERYHEFSPLEHPPFLQRLDFFLRGVHRYSRTLGRERRRKDTGLVEEEDAEYLSPGGVAHEYPQEVIGHMGSLSPSRALSQPFVQNQKALPNGRAFRPKLGQNYLSVTFPPTVGAMLLPENPRFSAGYALLSDTGNFRFPTPSQAVAKVT